MSTDLEIQVANAVHVLNHSPHSPTRVAANQWLVQFQHSPAAWSAASSLLTSSPASLPAEVLFFAAQILRRKIQAEARALHPPAHLALLRSLLLAARRFCLGPPQLLTQICLALSALVLRVADIEEVFASLRELQGQENGDVAVMEMLTVLPEEVAEDGFGDRDVEAGCRSRYTRELLSRTPMVLEFLLMQSEDKFQGGIQLHERNRKILRCLLSWVRVGCFSEIPANSLPTHPLLNFVFNSLQVSSSFDVAIEVLIELVSRYEGLPQVLLFRVQYLKEILLLPALANRDEKVIGGLACLMSEMGQAAPSLIAKASTEALALADALLSCVAFPSEDWEISDSTLQFWCSLASYLLGMDLDMASNRAVVEETFFPVFSALLDSLLLRAQVDDSEFDSLTGTVDIPDGLIQFRMNLEELLVDICRLLGSSPFVQKLFSGGWASSDSLVPWAEVETRMFALNMVAETVLQYGPPFDFSLVMRLVTILTSRTPTELKGFMCFVYKSVATVVGSYSKWMSSIASNMRPLLVFCASGITESVSSNACSSALHKLCEDAPALVHDPQNLEILIWVGEGLEKSNLPLEEEEEVVSAITPILNSVANKELKKNYLGRLLSSSYGAIEKLIDADSENSLRQNPAAYTHALNSTVRGLYRSRMTPFLFFWEYFGHFWRNFSDLVIWRMVAYLLLHADLFLKRFILQSHECYVRTAALVIEEFGHREEYGPMCIVTFERFTSAASVTALNSSYVCDQEPDLVEAYTNFTSTFVRCCPKGVIAASGTLLEFSFQKAAICCTAMHRGAALAAMSYMSCFLEVSLAAIVECMACIPDGSLSAVVIQVLSRSGEGLISNVIYALLGASAMSRVHKSATILQQLAACCSLSERTNCKSVLCWDSLRSWLQSTVQSLPSEYLRQGEAETIVPIWLEALSNAASDFLQSLTSEAGRVDRGHMRGKGGRTLKRIIRDFADGHRHVPNLT